MKWDFQSKAIGKFLLLETVRAVKAAIDVACDRGFRRYFIYRYFANAFAASRSASGVSSLIVICRAVASFG